MFVDAGMRSISDFEAHLSWISYELDWDDDSKAMPGLHNQIDLITLFGRGNRRISRETSPGWVLMSVQTGRAPNSAEHPEGLSTVLGTPNFLNSTGVLQVRHDFVIAAEHPTWSV